MELNYAEHTAEEDGIEVLDASHFVQQYSLLWEGAGLVRSGRAGRYDLALGYQWDQVDSEINGTTVDIDNPLDKILFRGDLLLAPGGLPFRLHLYSYDMNGLILGYQELGTLFNKREYDPQRGIVTGVQNGTRVTTGMTLMAGVKNGAYGGAYRDALNALPRLFVDFVQTDVKDLKGGTPLHYTDRDLAFVSLNKNKNWFHYRFNTHSDKISPENDYEQQTFLLGTIDHVDRRQWVDLTNWVQVSTDISYSETTPSENASESYQERYDYNLFAAAQRTSWDGGTYASFSRVRETNSLRKWLQVPVFANGRLNRDTTWRVRLESSRDESEPITIGTDSKEDNLFLASRLETFSQSRYVVSPVVDLEYKGGTQGRGNAVRAGVEVYNNQRYRTSVDVFGAYSATIYDGTSQNGEDVSYWEHQLEASFSKDLYSSLRTEFEQRLVLGTGTYDGSVTNYIKASANAVSSDSARTGGISDENYFRSTTSWAIDHRPASRFYNRVELEFDYADMPTVSGGQLSLFHNANYYGRSFRVSVDNELILGEDLSGQLNDDIDSPSGSTIFRQRGIVSNSFSSISRIDYEPSRVHQNMVKLDLEWREFASGGSDERYEFTQKYAYNFWKNSGLMRRIAVLGEEIEHAYYSPSIGESSSLLSFTLFSELYPTRQTLLSARLRYEVDSLTDTDTALVFLSAGVDFEKFQMALDYAYGTRTAGISEPERVEHKWEVKVKKIF